jgi:nucleoside-diphosphate-sugar epimerase
MINLAYRLADASSADPDPAFAVNVTGAQNVLEAARAHGVRRFVLGSSIAVYGDQSTWGEHALAETDERRPVRPYGWQKALNEVMAEQYTALFGVEAIAFRMSTVWGPGRTVGLSAPITDLIEPPPGAHTVVSPWPLDEAFDLVHRDDAAAALADVALAENLDHATYNSGGEYATVSDLADRLGCLRPEVRVRVAEPATSIRHCSRIDSSRLRDIFGTRPRRIFTD